MTRDHHPRERQARALARKKAASASYDRILIVCEGEKTEPKYFTEIRRCCKLHTANVKVTPSEYGTSPLQIVEFARDKFLETRQWEQVYCVFDRDEHRNYHDALQCTKSLDRRFKNDLDCLVTFKAIPSVPSFELWLLLHFDCITREVHRNEVNRMLKRPGRLTNYNKGEDGHFETTRHLLDTAYKHASRLAAQRQLYGNENPFTAVDELVKLLVNLKLS